MSAIRSKSDIYAIASFLYPLIVLNLITESSIRIWNDNVQGRLDAMWK